MIEFKEDKASYLIELSRDKQAMQCRIHICAHMHAHSTLVRSRPLPQLLVKRANLVVKALPPNLDLSLPEHEKQRCLRSIAHPSIRPLHSCASALNPNHSLAQSRQPRRSHWDLLAPRPHDRQ